LVLAGAIMAGHRRRVFDAVVLKVLGATRIRVIGAYVIEYGLQGAFAAIVACGVGSLAAFIVVTRLMRADFVLDPAIVAGTGLLSVVLTVGLGLVGTWRALGERPGPLLRNE
jgi:putative ABC transport system permease protein